MTTGQAPKILCRNHADNDGVRAAGHPFHGPACPLTSMPVDRRIRMAISDPGAVLPRQSDQDDYESIPNWSTRALQAVLEQIAFHQPTLLLGDGETRIEYGVSWHSGEPYADDEPGNILFKDKIGWLEQAVRAGAERIGDYGITWFTVERRTHVLYPNGSVWIGGWGKVARADVDAVVTAAAVADRDAAV